MAPHEVREMPQPLCGGQGTQKVLGIPLGPMAGCGGDRGGFPPKRPPQKPPLSPHDHLWTSHQDHRSLWGCLFLPACHHLCHGHHLRLEKVVEGTLRALDCIATLVAFCFPGEVLVSPTWTRALPVSRSDLDVLRKCVFLNVIVNLSLIQFITHQKVCHIWF